MHFGTTPPGSTIQRTIDLRNVGTAPLSLSGPASVSAGFTLTAALGATKLAPGDQTSFTLQIDAVAKGSYGGQTSLATNDADEDPLVFDIVSEVDFIPLFVDNGDRAFSLSGQWGLWTNQGYQGDVHEAFPGDCSDVATRTFVNMAPGLYQVSATWTTNPNRAPGALFRIDDDDVLASAARVIQ